MNYFLLWYTQAKPPVVGKNKPQMKTDDEILDTHISKIQKRNSGSIKQEVNAKKEPIITTVGRKQKNAQDKHEKEAKAVKIQIIINP